MSAMDAALAAIDAEINASHGDRVDPDHDLTESRGYRRGLAYAHFLIREVVGP